LHFGAYARLRLQQSQPSTSVNLVDLVLRRL
jgi:hypothetical protein